MFLHIRLQYVPGVCTNMSREKLDRAELYRDLQPMDNSTFSSDNSVQNSKSENNFSIRSENKIENILPEASFSRILSVIKTPSPPQDDFCPVIPSRITSPIPMGNNSKIPSGDVFLVTPS